MDCDKYSKKIPEYIRGDLQKSEITKLEAHLETCEHCREEVKDLQWFLTGVRSNASTISAGHISSRLLYEFAENNPILNPVTAERIENHLSACEACRRDLERINELIALELPEGGVTSRPSASLTGWFSGFRFRTAAVGLAAVAALIMVVWVIFESQTGPNYEAALISTGVDYDIVDIPLHEPVRGEQDPLPATQLQETEAGTIVLQLELDLFEGEKPPTSLSIEDEAGKAVWSGQLLKQQAKTGRILLLVDKATFAAGRYTIRFLREDGTSMGQATVEL